MVFHAADICCAVSISQWALSWETHALSMSRWSFWLNCNGEFQQPSLWQDYSFETVLQIEKRGAGGGQWALRVQLSFRRGIKNPECLNGMSSTTWIAQKQLIKLIYVSAGNDSYGLEMTKLSKAEELGERVMLWI